MKWVKTWKKEEKEDEEEEEWIKSCHGSVKGLGELGMHVEDVDSVP